MKPLTVLWITWCAMAITLNAAAYANEQQTINLWIIGGLLACLAYWINTGRKENRLRRDLQSLVNDMAKDIIAHKKLIVAMNPSEDRS